MEKTREGFVVQYKEEENHLFELQRYYIRTDVHDVLLRIDENNMVTWYNNSPAYGDMVLKAAKEAMTTHGVNGSIFMRLVETAMAARGMITDPLKD